MISDARVIVLDFDGTTVQGDGPVIAYADETATLLRPGAAANFLADVSRALADPDARARYADGHNLVRHLAEDHGIGEQALGRGYAAARAYLGTDRAPVELAPGLDAFLALAEAARARVVLATNSPETRIPDTLRALGIHDRFDAISFDTGKPAGLGPLIDTLGPPDGIVSVGDVWRNDLEPAAARGCCTALIGNGYPLPVGAHPTWCARSFVELAPLVADWLSGAPPPGRPVRRSPLATASFPSRDSYSEKGHQ